MLVEGNLEFRNLGAGNSLTINAGQNIEVNTDTGSIAMLGTGDALGGTLNLNAANVWIAQQSILTQLEANPNYSGRDAALAVNNGTSNLDGFVGADAVAIAVSSSLFGQNSGTADDWPKSPSAAAASRSPAPAKRRQRSMSTDASWTTEPPSLETPSPTRRSFRDPSPTVR